MKIKTSELTGTALDYTVSLITNPEWTEEDRWYSTLWYVATGDPDDEPYMPSENWAQGGPIIEREGIATREIPPVSGDNGHIFTRRWIAEMFRFPGGPRRAVAYGTTPLVAAMRCYVVSRLGDEVNVPDSFPV